MIINNHKIIKPKTPSDDTCLGKPPEVFVMLIFILLLLLFFICRFSLFTFFFDIIAHTSVDYRQVFRPILYFQLSPSQSDSRHFHFPTIPLSSYRERYGFEWTFFTHRQFLPYAPFQHFWHNMLLSRLPWEPAVIP